jgi:hypothetical protein
MFHLERPVESDVFVLSVVDHVCALINVVFELCLCCALAEHPTATARACCAYEPPTTISTDADTSTGATAAPFHSLLDFRSQERTHFQVTLSTDVFFHVLTFMAPVEIMALSHTCHAAWSNAHLKQQVLAQFRRVLARNLQVHFRLNLAHLFGQSSVADVKPVSPTGQQHGEQANQVLPIDSAMSPNTTHTATVASAAAAASTATAAAAATVTAVDATAECADLVLAGSTVMCVSRVGVR